MNFIESKSITKFKNHNYKIFEHSKKKSNSIILVEFHGWCSAHICYSYLINTLKKKFKSKVLAYEGYTLISSKIDQTIFQKIKSHVGKSTSLNFFGVYDSIGTEEFIRVKKSRYIDIKYNEFCKKKINLKNKNDLINLKINNIWVGDLIYDTFLKIKKVPTINIHSEEFIKFFNDAVYVFFYWNEFFKKNNVKALIISHSTYLYGMVMRIANSSKVTVYKPTFNTIYKIKKKNFTIGDEFFSLKKKFQNLPKKIQKNGLKLAENEIEEMYKGNKKFALGYNYKNRKVNILKVNKNKILIAMHNFYDSPHVFGKMLFPDFYEWLNHIVELSKKTNHEWYFKLHPENTKKDLNLIKKILSKNKKIKLISSKINNNIIFNIGINCVLTCFGSIGYEFAYQGIKVINACVRNPHAGYGFTLNPKTITEFDHMILNIHKIKLNIKKAEILEFLFMRRYFLRINWLQLSTNQISKGFGWKNKIYRPYMYDVWVNEFDNKKHNKINRICNKFITSNHYKLERLHCE